MERKQWSKDFLLKRAEQERDKGNFSRAKYFYHRYLEQGGRREEAVVWLVDRYIEEGRVRKGINFLKRMARRLGYPRTLLDRLSTLLEEMGAVAELEEFVKEVPYGEEYLQSLHIPADLNYSDEDLMQIINLFSGREGVHARMWISPNKKIGYAPVNAPVTPSVLKKHLAGKYTIGIYQLKLNNTVNWVVFDIDISYKSLKEIIKNGEKFDRAMGQILELSKNLKGELSKRGIPSYIEDSGFKGYHIWVFFAEPISAGVAREFAQLVSEDLRLPPQFHMEIFPKQVKLPPKGYGNLVKLPGGMHLKSGRRSFFLEEENFINFVHKAERIKGDEFKRKFWQMRKEKAKREPAPLVLETSEDFRILRNSCSVIDTIVDKILQLIPISSTEKKVLEHTIGHLEEGPAILSSLFSMIGYKTSLRSPHRGNPISCARIKKELKYLTSSLPCDCKFPYTDTYPNPLLHLRNKDKNLQLSSLIRKLDYLRKQKQTLEMKIEEVEGLIMEKIKQGAKSDYGMVKIEDGKILIELK